MEAFLNEYTVFCGVKTGRAVRGQKSHDALDGQRNLGERQYGEE